MSAAPSAPGLSKRYAFATLSSALFVAVIIIAGMTLYLPKGAAGIDQIAIPVVLFPLVWVTVALTLFGAKNRKRAWAIVGVVFAVHFAGVVYKFATTERPAPPAKDAAVATPDVDKSEVKATTTTPATPQQSDGGQPSDVQPATATKAATADGAALDDDKGGHQ